MGAAWGTPEEVLRLPQGVRSVSAGLHSSAAVTRDGQLWMWGKVISEVSLLAACLERVSYCCSARNMPLYALLNAGSIAILLRVLLELLVLCLLACSVVCMIPFVYLDSSGGCAAEWT